MWKNWIFIGLCPCGRSPPCLAEGGHIPYHGVFFLVLFIVCRELVGPHFWPMSVRGQAREQPELLWPERNSSAQCSDTKLDNNWKCQQGLICPFNWAFQRSHSFISYSTLGLEFNLSLWLVLTSLHLDLWLVSLLSVQVSVCEPDAWMLNGSHWRSWVGDDNKNLASKWTQTSPFGLSLSWTYDTRESNLKTAGIRTLGPYKHHDIGY